MSLHFLGRSFFFYVILSLLELVVDNLQVVSWSSRFNW